MRFSYGRVAFFLIFGVCKIRARFGGVLGGSGGGFLRHFGPDLVDFEGFEKESNFELEVGSRKSGFRDVQGPSRGGSGGPIIDR